GGGKNFDSDITLELRQGDLDTALNGPQRAALEHAGIGGADDLHLVGAVLQSAKTDGQIGEIDRLLLENFGAEAAVGLVGDVGEGVAAIGPAGGLGQTRSPLRPIDQENAGDVDPVAGGV